MVKSELRNLQGVSQKKFDLPSKTNSTTSIICLYSFVKRYPKLIANILICLWVEHVQAKVDFLRVAIDKGAEEAVPHGKNISKVGVGPGALEVVVELVHVWRYEHVTERFVHPQGEFDVGMREVSEEDGANAVKKIVPRGNTSRNHCDQGKNFAYHKITGMVTRTAGSIKVRVAVMDHVEFPHPLHTVKDVVDKVLSNQLKQHNADEKLKPDGQVYHVS
jgi:hypothetical protein